MDDEPDTSREAPRDRKTLASSGMKPGTHSLEALAGMGM